MLAGLPLTPTIATFQARKQFAESGHLAELMPTGGGAGGLTAAYALRAIRTVFQGSSQRWFVKAAIVQTT
ncbi:hypothetical protein B2G71_22570 [Novosphingobium sp. PC22D]|nr:hypothetical protein B2G71_22570 [Novosphingobium sp. PC22D]